MMNPTGEKAREFMTAYIAKNRERSVGVVSRLMSEVIHDTIVPKSSIKVEPMGLEVALGLSLYDGVIPVDRSRLHPHALRQIAERVGVPSANKVVSELGTSEWGRRLTAEIVNEHLEHNVADPTRYLVRSVGDQIRGVLSDKFRRLDTRPVLGTAIEEATNLGGVVANGWSNDTRISLRVLIPEVIETVEGTGDYVAFGLDYSGSDYGDGAIDMKAFILRVLCLNGMMTSSEFRQIHLGRRLPENITFSEETYRLDTEATTSAVRDMTRTLLSQERRTALLGSIRKAAAEKIDPKEKLAVIRKRLTKGESDAIASSYATAGIEELPPGENSWRFAQAIALVARNIDDGVRRMELEGLAGQVMEGSNPTKAERESIAV